MANKSMSQRKKILKETLGKCGYCEVFLGEKFEIDHVIPRSRGGTSCKSNLLAACFRCNRIKAAKDLVELKKKLKIEAFWFERLLLRRGSIYQIVGYVAGVPVLTTKLINPFKNFCEK